MIKSLVRRIDYLTALVTQRGKYQVVITLPLRSGAIETFATTPAPRRAAIQNWRWRVASGLFASGTGRTARVLSVAEARKAGIR